ncbi:TPA: hypothetical protein NV714_002011 [Escherichia coli]|nr:hypothetical protein [Escherichia coli]
MKVKSVLIIHNKENSKIKVLEHNVDNILEAVRNYVSLNIIDCDIVVDEDSLNNILLDYNIWCEKENNNVYHLKNQNADLYFSDSIEEIQKIHTLKGSQRTLGFGIEKIN